MKFVDNENTTDPRVNLAIEEYLLQSHAVEDDILLFYINAPSIIIGRFQNTLEEINRDYVKEKDLFVVRRLSGGGAVYHDLGNINYSLITRGGKEDAVNFKKFTAPVIKALKKMGVEAELSGRNDICVEERKISGNAIYSKPRGIVCHGTLLFKTDLSQLAKALKVKKEKIASKGIKSVRSRVANISEYLDENITIEDLRQTIIDTIFEEGVEQYRLTEEDWKAIHELSEKRYKTWGWNYDQGPAFNIEKNKRFPFGQVNARIQVENGHIQSIKFHGDFFGTREIEVLEETLANTHYTVEDIKRVLQDIKIETFISGMTDQDFLEFIY